MDVYRPIRAGLFFYECLRLLLLAVLLFLAHSEGAVNGVSFPYPVYLSSNALFALMALFMWLNAGEYRNYVSLYMAGKAIVVVLFYVWEIIGARRQFPGAEIARNAAGSIFLTGGSAVLSLADILSLWGAWALRNKWRGLPAREHGGL